MEGTKGRPRGASRVAVEYDRKDDGEAEEFTSGGLLYLLYIDGVR
jgi:hypothetical protein